MSFCKKMCGLDFENFNINLSQNIDKEVSKGKD